MRRLAIAALVLMGCAPAADPVRVQGSELRSADDAPSAAAPASRAEPVGPVVLTLDGPAGVWLGLPEGARDAGNYAAGIGDVWGHGDYVFAASSEHVLRSADGGATWTKHASLVGANRFWGPSEREIYLAGDHGLARSRDIGLTWQRLDTGVSTFLLSVWGNDDVWAVGGDGVVIGSSDRGARWKRFDVGAAETLYDVWGSGPREVFVAGSRSSGAALFRTRDRGATWTAIDIPDPCASARRVGGSGGVLYVACADGSVFASNDDGGSWREIGSFGVELLDMDVLGSRKLVVVGRNQTIRHTDDAGKSWRSESPIGKKDLSELRGWWSDRRGTTFVAGLGTTGSGGWLLRRR